MLRRYCHLRSAGLRMEHVPYKGAGPAIVGHVGSEIQLYLGGGGLGAQHVKAGRLKALAVSGASRIDALPDTPTFAEAGITGVEASNWWARRRPGVPRPPPSSGSTRRSVLRSRPQVRAQLQQLGVQPIPGTPDAMAQRLAAEAPAWRRAVAESGVKLD